MLAFYPEEGATERIVWYGGESTQLHYEVQVDDYKGDLDWIARETQTLGGGLPTSVKELYTAMCEFYQEITCPI
jgi:hypothetical protein